MLNNELKFKAFNKVTRKAYRSGTLSFSTERHSFILFTEMKEVGDYKDDDVEIMQYIGQKDAENKELYQRDIVELEGNRYVIVWDNNRGGWSITDVERRMTMKAFGRTEANQCNVIGNEFETPDLMNPSVEI
jgi:uncharacterized phage protein (TIGR01671 family)